MKNIDSILSRPWALLLTGLLVWLLFAMSGCKTLKHTQKETMHIDSTGKSESAYTIETETHEQSAALYEIPGSFIVGEVDPCDTTEQVIESGDLKTIIKKNPATGNKL